MKADRPDRHELADHDPRPTRTELAADEHDEPVEEPLTFRQRVLLNLRQHTDTLDVELADALGVVIFP